jgi:signal transduction histidine kinase
MMFAESDILNASILIVDDQDSYVSLLEQLLRETGYTCVASTMNPKDVCTLHRNNHYDLILLDLQMPGMDGFQVMEGLKTIAFDSYLPVLVITAQPDHKVRALQAGAKDFISKPFDLVEVKTRIHNMLEVRLLYKKLKNYNMVLEQSVLEQTRELRQKDQMLILQDRQAVMGEMINNIAHQWRQPLNMLGLTIQQLSLYHDLGEFTKEFLDNSVNRSMGLIQHMSQTIDDFRNYFRPDKEKVEFKVQEAITSTLSLIEENFKSQQIGVELVAKGDSVIYGFRNEFAQVVLNILNNARDVLMEREIKDPRVTITLGSENGRAVVTISDNAGGIPEEIIGKIFDPYFTTKGPQTGTGVGLFMSKTIIEKNMGGSLTAQNSADGAEFRIEV